MGEYLVDVRRVRKEGHGHLLKYGRGQGQMTEGESQRTVRCDGSKRKTRRGHSLKTLEGFFDTVVKMQD